jgi:hypothetical protein
LAATALILTLAAALLIAGADKQQIKINTERLGVLEENAVTKADFRELQGELRVIRKEIGDANINNTSDHSNIKERLARIETSQEVLKREKATRVASK